MKRRKLTMKQREFVKHYTNEKNPETFGNGTQSAKKIYNVANDSVANAIAVENLQKPLVIEAIEKRIVKKEDIEHSLVTFTEKIQEKIKDDVSLENVPLLKELREYHMASAKVGGLLIDRVQNMNVTIDLSDDDVKSKLDELLNGK